MGRGGEPLHSWALDSVDVIDAEVLREATEATGAVVMGRRLFDIVDGPHGWSDDMGYGAAFAGTPPFYVVTHSVPDVNALANSIAATWHPSCSVLARHYSPGATDASSSSARFASRRPRPT